MWTLSVLQRALFGIFWTTLSGLVTNVDMLLSAVLLEQAWPYWRINAFSCVLASIVLAGQLAWQRPPMPHLWQAKWIFLEGLFGSIDWCVGIVAVQIGVSPGDVAALTSINIVASAMLGRMFLNETLRWQHGVAVIMSTCGAVLISQPSFVFGSTDTARAPAIGYLAAITAGVFQAGFFVTSRKAADVHVDILSLSSMLISAVFCAVLPCTNLVTDADLGIMWASPPEGVGWIGVIFVTSWCSATFGCTGATMCPAAVSAAVYAASSMLFGYLAASCLLGSRPSVVTISGAVLMFSAVVVMAVFQPADAKLRTVVEALVGDDWSPASSASTREVVEEDELDESFASFAASELSEFWPSEHPPVRRRRTSILTGGGLVPTEIGASITSVMPFA
mmetsp:Transcript_69868/g.197080  ORF Transcript_69868/g.197080 Transcript_69868/m.197080 type:complete len:392 (+) Transcript_69868:85-1260(+)